jgi:hypothetical protein
MPEGYHLRSRRSPRCQLQPLVSQHGDSLPRHACPLTPRPCRHGERERPCSCGAGADPGGAAASWAAVELRGSDRRMAATPHPRDPALPAPRTPTGFARPGAQRGAPQRRDRRTQGRSAERDDRASLQTMRTERTSTRRSAKSDLNQVATGWLTDRASAATDSADRQRYAADVPTPECYRTRRRPAVCCQLQALVMPHEVTMRA